MTGLELAKAYYETYGKRMLAEEFPRYVDRIAVGLAGKVRSALVLTMPFPVTMISVRLSACG